MFLIIHSNFTLTKPRCKYTNISEHTRKNFIFFRLFTIKSHQTTTKPTAFYPQNTTNFASTLSFLYGTQHITQSLSANTAERGDPKLKKKFLLTKPTYRPNPQSREGGIACHQPPRVPPPGSMPPPSSVTVPGSRFTAAAGAMSERCKNNPPRRHLPPQNRCNNKL